MRCLPDAQVNTYNVEWKGDLKARGERWPVRFKPRPREWASPFAFGWSVRYSKRFNDWVVCIVVIARGRVSMQAEDRGNKRTQ